MPRRNAKLEAIQADNETLRRALRIILDVIDLAPKTDVMAGWRAIGAVQSIASRALRDEHPAPTSKLLSSG